MWVSSQKRGSPGNVGTSAHIKGKAQSSSWHWHHDEVFPDNYWSHKAPSFMIFFYGELHFVGGGKKIETVPQSRLVVHAWNSLSQTKFMLLGILLCVFRNCQQSKDSWPLCGVKPDEIQWEFGNLWSFILHKLEGWHESWVEMVNPLDLRMTWPIY